MFKILAKIWMLLDERKILIAEISLFGMMQGGRSPSSELYQLDMYCSQITQHCRCMLHNYIFIFNHKIFQTCKGTTFTTK